MSEFWDEVQYFFALLWGDSWSGYESVGRYLLLLLAAIIAALIIGGTAGWIRDRRFIASCYARGGHVHYQYHKGPSIGVLVGSVIVMTPTSTRTMKFAPGKEENCRKC